MFKGFLSVIMLLARVTRFFFIILVGISLWACSPAAPTVEPAATQTSIPLFTQTPIPPATLTPTAQPPVVALLAPEGADAALVSALEQVLSDLTAAQGEGWRVQVVTALDPGGMGPVRIVAALPPAANLAELAAAAPDTQFLSIGIPGVEPAANLSVIGGQGERPDQMAFLAGYIAASITTDWRAAAIVEPETPAGRAGSLAFTNGIKFFCGLCQPAYPPFPRSGYPLVVEVAPGATSNLWQEQITYLQAWQVKTVYVQPQAAQEMLLEDLANAGFQLILAGPPPEGLRQHWVASLGSSDLLAAVHSAWESMLAGEGGQMVTLPIGFSSVNSDLLSIGKQRLAEELLKDLLAGFVHTGVDPLTGDNLHLP